MLYLVFNEGYTSTSGPDLARADLTWEAIRLARTVFRLLPDDGEVAGLLALMLLTEARRPARTTPDGSLVPLAEQDRRLWNSGYLAEGVDLISRSLTSTPLGPYQLQAAIAAIHDETPTAQDTDWPQIVALYELLEHRLPTPTVRLNQAVAVAMASGPAAGLRMLDEADTEDRIVGHHRFDAVRAHLQEMADALAAARQTTAKPRGQPRACRRSATSRTGREVVGSADRLTQTVPTASDLGVRPGQRTATGGR